MKNEPHRWCFGSWGPGFTVFVALGLFWGGASLAFAESPSSPKCEGGKFDGEIVEILARVCPPLGHLWGTVPLRYSGEISLKHSSWELRGELLEVSFDAAGEPLWVGASGRVRFAWMAGLIEGERAHYDGARQRWIFEGEVSLQRGVSVLKGEKIIVDLEREEVEILRGEGGFVWDE